MIWILYLVTFSAGELKEWDAGMQPFKTKEECEIAAEYVKQNASFAIKNTFCLDEVVGETRNPWQRVEALNIR